MKKIGLLLALLVFAGINILYAQNMRVTGTVTSAEDGTGIPGATVKVKGGTTGVVTDADGKYSISVNANATLVFSFVGTKTQEIQVTGQNVIDVKLQSDVVGLDEVVVVGYGVMKKKDVTSSISQVKGGDISNLASPSFDQQLAGRAAGVQITQPSGVLGESPVMRIRGVNSISSGTEPLIVIDGVPVSSGNSGMLYAKNNALSDINPSDIESFEILKDGAATAIYGSRASNGVVLITTKKGKKGKLSFNYDAYAGWSNASKLPKLLNAEQFVEITDEKYANYGGESPARLDDNKTNTKWTDYVFHTGFQHSHNFSAAGGNDKSNYYFSVGYTNQEGITVGNKLERFSLRANLDHQFTDWAKFGVNISGSRQQVNGLVEGSNSLSDVMFSTIRMLPNVAVYNANDATGFNVDASNRKALGRGANLSVIDNSIPNIMWLLKNNVNRSTSYRALTSTYMELKLIDELRFKTQIGVDLQLVDDYMKWSPESGDGYSYGGLIEQVYTPSYRWNWQNILSYNKKIGENNIDLTAVQEYTKYKYNYIDASVHGMSDAAFMDNIITGTYANQEVNGGIQSNGLASYLFRANYNYAGKYFIGGSVRTDGLSKLPKDNRWGTFYGVSAAWKVSEEKFWKEFVPGSISDFRLRGSYATVGNQNINGNYPYMGTYKAIKYGSQTGIAFNNTSNPSLKWESQKITDLGFDMGLLSGRFNFSFAWWKKDNSDIVLDAPTAPSYGIPGNTISKNIGSISNTGLEFTLGGTIISNKDFSWNANLNFSTQKNKVEKLVNGEDMVGKFTIVREGQSMNAIYGYRYAGVNKANGNPMYYKADGSIVQFDLMGNYDYAVYDPKNPSDVSQSASLSATSDKAILGTSLPKWFGGFENNLKYKNLDLSLFFRFSGGNKIMNASRQDLLNMDFANNGTEILGRWKSVSEPGDGKTPLICYGQGAVLNNEQEASSRFVEKGDFLKLSNVTLGYTLPKDLLLKFGIEKFRVYAQVQNVFTLTKYKGLDPEVFTAVSDTDFKDSFGVDWNGKPQQRIFSVGVNLGF